MKKIRIYKKTLANVSEDDMSFIEAYQAIKEPVCPKEKDYHNTVQEILSTDRNNVTEAELVLALERKKDGATIRIGASTTGWHIISVGKKVDSSYEKAVATYDAKYKKYKEDMEALHPIVADILAKAKQ